MIAFLLALRVTQVTCAPTPAAGPVEEDVGLVFLATAPWVKHGRGFDRLHPPMQGMLDSIVKVLGSPAIAPVVPIDSTTEFVNPGDRRFPKLEAPVPPIGAWVMIARPREMRDGEDSVRTVNPALNRQLLDALRRMVTPDRIAGLLDLAGADSLELLLYSELRTADRVDRGASASVAWFAQQLPLYEVRPVVRIDVAPSLKQFYEKFGVDVTGRVSVQYVVGADGLPAIGTLRVVELDADGPAELAARYFLSNQRYEPRKVGRCPFSQLVQQRLNFSPRNKAKG